MSGVGSVDTRVFATNHECATLDLYLIKPIIIKNSIKMSSSFDDADETIIERIVALREMFPESLCTLIGKSKSLIKTIFSSSKAISWIIASTAAVLVLPISLETERQEYEQQMKRQERNILLGPESPGL